MAWLYIIVFFSAATAGLAINRPVYKIVLTQKGYAQFLQYDIETPPLREFTFCTWFRIYDLTGDQSIFTYVANGNNRVVRLWLVSGGKHINVSIDEKVSATLPIDITKDTWRHVCLSYQSDYGAWALYVDARLISCQASQNLYGFILPSSGSVIVGYGTDVNGVQNGLEGEIFGANMILMSTIERNYSMKNNPQFEQKPFRKNRLKHGEHKLNYIILNDLQSDGVNNNFETTIVPEKKTTSSFIRLNTPHSFIEHEVGSHLKSKTYETNSLNTNGFPSLSVIDKNTASGNSNVEPLNTNIKPGKYSIHDQSKNEVLVSQVINLPSISEFEVPPPAPSYSVYETATERTKSSKKYIEEPLAFEVPPPVENNPKVYGQWTSSKFAGNVLNYLKNMHYRTWYQKQAVPQTIPLNKISDSFPYASDFKVFKVRPPISFQRKILVEKQLFGNKKKQINVQILEDDLRSNILKSHAQSLPKNVEISSRGITKKRLDRRFYRHVEKDESRESTETMSHLDSAKTRKTNEVADFSLQTENLMAILPFLKSLEYFIEDSQNIATHDIEKKEDMYTKSLSLANKWHNIQSYNNDYTPREITGRYEGSDKNIDEKKVALPNKKRPSIRLKYKSEDSKVVQYRSDDSILKGRALAMDVSNQSDYNKDSISILKYNHGYLPTRQTNKKNITVQRKPKKNERVSFLIPVKIGNALNERPVIGDNVEQNKKSFVGGDERIPDINKHRTEIDNEDFTIPGSLGPRICKNLELYDRVLYVQVDESIDMSHILSPVRAKNGGIEFIMQNYKKCSLQESNLQNNVMLFIDWSKTPVRLFGGAYVKKTTDLCGFF